MIAHSEIMALRMEVLRIQSTANAIPVDLQRLSASHVTPLKSGSKHPRQDSIDTPLRYAPRPCPFSGYEDEIQDMDRSVDGLGVLKAEDDDAIVRTETQDACGAPRGDCYSDIP
jgi:hypothetical protein